MYRLEKVAHPERRKKNCRPWRTVIIVLALATPLLLTQITDRILWHIFQHRSHSTKFTASLQHVTDISNSELDSKRLVTHASAECMV